MTYKLTQAQYARIYGVTERSVRTYQGQEMPLDEPGNMVAFLLLRKTPPPGLNSPEQAKMNYNREAGIVTVPTPARLERLEELIWKFWDTHNEITAFVRETNWPRGAEIEASIGNVSGTVMELRALAGIPERATEPGEEEE